MTDIPTNNDSLDKLGFCAFRNFLSADELKKHISILDDIYKKIGRKSDKFIHLEQHREAWEIIFNDRMLDVLRSLLGPKIHYLHDASFRYSEEQGTSLAFSQTECPVMWHRDNPCRRFGKGPDWDKNEPYSVVTAVIYLTPYNENKSGVNVIPFSHKKTYTLSNMLRLIHEKTKNIPFLTKLRNLFPNFVGINVRTNPGDLIIFKSNLYHTALPFRNLRHAVYFHYGLDNKHSKNWMNYFHKHRAFTHYKIDDKDESKYDEFFDLLKRKDIFIPLPEKKESIEASSIPKQEREELRKN